MSTQPTTEQIAALQAYAKANGRCWKKALIEDWMCGTDTQPSLRQVRNEFGPTWLLDKFKLPKP